MIVVAGAIIAKNLKHEKHFREVISSKNHRRRNGKALPYTNTKPGTETEPGFIKHVILFTLNS